MDFIIFKRLLLPLVARQRCAIIGFGYYFYFLTTKGILSFVFGFRRMGAGLGFEPRIRTNLVPMTDYKTVRLPLTYPALFNF